MIKFPLISAGSGPVLPKNTCFRNFKMFMFGKTYFLSVFTVLIGSGYRDPKNPIALANSVSKVVLVIAR